MRRRWGFLNIFLLIFLANCGSAADPNSPYLFIYNGKRIEWFFDEDLKQYDTDFQSISTKWDLPEGHRSTLWRIEYGDVKEEHTLGYCYTVLRKNSINGRVISRYDMIMIHNKVRNWTPLMKRVLIFHEELHCIYEMPHLFGEENSGRIMAPILSDDINMWEIKWEFEMERTMQDVITKWGTVNGEAK